MTTTDTETGADTPCNERRLTANRANAQLSTGPRTLVGKAISSLNAVKTGLCGRTVLLADADEARAYREHVERVTAWWNPDNVEEHALVQALADTQWRLEAIPGLESTLYAQARLRGEPVLTHPDPAAQRLLLDARKPKSPKRKRSKTCACAGSVEKRWPTAMASNLQPVKIHRNPRQNSPILRLCRPAMLPGRADRQRGIRSLTLFQHG